MTRVKTFEFSQYYTNSYLCYSGEDAVLVDASAQTGKEIKAVEKFLRRKGLALRYLLLTHGHIDHILACAHFARKHGMLWHAHADTRQFLRLAPVQASFFGTTVDPPPHNVNPLRDGDTISFGKTVWEVLHTPGHAPGSICFYDRPAGFVIVGDVLFQNSIGRDDLPGGNLPLLLQSIHQRLLTLPGETIVYPGHGPATTIARERAHNPFLQ